MLRFNLKAKGANLMSKEQVIENVELMMENYQSGDAVSIQMETDDGKHFFIVIASDDDMDKSVENAISEAEDFLEDSRTDFGSCEETKSSIIKEYRPVKISDVDIEKTSSKKEKKYQ